jgi:hypothetical protein
VHHSEGAKKPGHWLPDLNDDRGRRTLVVTGAWTLEAEQILIQQGVDGLDLNYAHGFCEASLES